MYTTDSKEIEDIDQCLYSSLFRMASIQANYAIGRKHGSYLAFESGVFCQEPSTFASLMHLHSDHSVQSDVNCMCDELGNCYYSNLCRDWYVKQMNKLDCK
jgi:hypothetical protein